MINELLNNEMINVIYDNHIIGIQYFPIIHFPAYFVLTFSFYLYYLIYLYFLFIYFPNHFSSLLLPAMPAIFGGFSAVSAAVFFPFWKHYFSVIGDFRRY